MLRYAKSTFVEQIEYISILVYSTRPSKNKDNHTLIMSKVLKNIPVKLIVGAGQAAPTPPVGPALGSQGVKAIDFCKEFNAKTAHYNPGVPIPVKVIVRPDRTFTFVAKSPSTTWLLLQAAGLEKGAPEAGKGKYAATPAATISLKHIYEIAKIKKTDELHKDIDMKQICKMLISSATSCGIKVVV